MAQRHNVVEPARATHPPPMRPELKRRADVRSRAPRKHAASARFEFKASLEGHSTEKASFGNCVNPPHHHRCTTYVRECDLFGRDLPTQIAFKPGFQYRAIVNITLRFAPQHRGLATNKARITQFSKCLLACCRMLFPSKGSRTYPEAHTLAGERVRGKKLTRAEFETRQGGALNKVCW